MRIDEVVRRSLTGSDLFVRVRGDAAVEVGGVTMDSRAVRDGMLFACVPGRRVDGHGYASAAVSAGAVALLCERPLDLPVPQILVTSTRPALGRVAAAVYGDPSSTVRVVGVTGTNGKTTTCALLGAIFEASGWSSAVVGTLTQERTTPEAPELQARLAELRAEGRRAVAMEVSSHALSQDRVAGVRFAAGVLTNVTQDHLDYHGTMEAYFAAKARLWEDGRSAVAVVNRDDPYGRRLSDQLRGRGGGAPSLREYGMDDAGSLELTPAGSTFVWHGSPVTLRIGGRFNVANALAAATTADALGIDRTAIVAGLGSLERVRGRFEAVDAGQPFTVLVDYAHTPDGLRQALGAARELAGGRLIVVFGAGGDRDVDKRPQMGRAAGEVADLAIITSDNPRSEDPSAIIEQVAAGAPDPDRIRLQPDRAEAIETAMWLAGPGDVVVIAGKGHETGQEIAGRRLPFDDAAVAREAITKVVARRREPERP